MHAFGIADPSTIIAIIIASFAIFAWTIVGLPYLWSQHVKKRQEDSNMGIDPTLPEWAFGLLYRLGQAFGLLSCCASAVIVAIVLANQNTLVFPSWRALFHQIGLL